MTLGSDPACDIQIEGLAGLECTIYLSTEGYYANQHSSEIKINDVPGPGHLRDNDIITLGGWLSVRFTLAVEKPTTGPAPSRVVPDDAPPQRVLRRGHRRHRPALATIASLLAPGAGQAYNGHPLKGLFFLVTAVLAIPWVFSVFNANTQARKIEASGGRSGRGGPLWLALHVWLMVNLGLLALVALTVAGVLE